MWNIIEISPTIRPYEDRITATLDAVRSRIEKCSDLKLMNFKCKADRSRTLDIHGFGGGCYDPDLIKISFNPKNPNMVNHLGETLERVVAHEYHHALRWAGPGYGAKLGSALASEGLAGQFVKQLYNSKPEPWEAAFTEDELVPWRNRAYKEFDARNHGHANWFFGANGNPGWLGYTLGYKMVGRYLSDHPDQTALSLAATPYTEFRESVLLQENLVAT